MDTRWSSTAKLLVIISLLVIGVWLLALFNQAIIPLLIAFILAYLLKPPTDWLVEGTGWPRGFAILIVFLILIFILVMLPVLATPGVVSLVSRISIDAQTFVPMLDRLGAEVIEIGPLVFNFDLGDLAQQAVEGLQTLITPFASGAFLVIAGVANSVLWIVFIVVVTFWLLKDSYKFEGWVLSLLPQAYRGEFTQLFRELGLIWGSFFRGELVLALTVGTLVGISMWILGVDNALLLAFIAGLMEFVPTLGPIIAAIPALIIAWFGGSSWLPINNLALTVIVAITYIVIFQVEQLYLLPRILGRRVRLHPGVVFVGTIIGAVQFGIIGVLLAAPVIASVRLFASYIYRKLLDLEPFTDLPGADPLSLEFRGMVRGQPVAAVLFDLDGTLINSDDDAVKRIAAGFGPLQRLFPGGDAQPFVRHLLMLGEGPINWLITQFDRLNLDDEAFRLNNWLRHALGQVRPSEMTLIPGVDDTLRTLAQSYPLAIVTTRSRASTQEFLDMFDLNDLFAVVVTRDDVQRLKPHPEPVLQAVEKLGQVVEGCVMVGDTSVDVQAARAAGTSMVAVLCGFGQYQDLKDADVILDSTVELGKWL